MQEFQGLGFQIVNLRVFLYSVGAGFLVQISGIAWAGEVSQAGYLVDLNRDIALLHTAAMSRDDGSRNNTAIHRDVLPLQIAAVETASSSTGAATSAKRTSSASRKQLPLGSAKVSDAFKVLDGESESVLKEVLNLGSDLAVVDEREKHPAKTQLLVMVAMQPTDLFELNVIELRIDKQVVAAYHYSAEDVAALKKGGNQRLYLTNLPTGMHELQASMRGKVPRDPDYRQEASLKFISGVSREVIELNITNEASKGFPTLVPKEWK